MRHMRSVMWQRVNSVTDREEHPPRPYLEARSASWKGCDAPGDEHLPASRCSSADSRVSVLYKGDYPFLRIAAVSHNVTRRCKARLRSATRASFRSVRERTDPFAKGTRGKLTKVLHTRVAAWVGRYDDRFFPEATCDVRRSFFGKVSFPIKGPILLFLYYVTLLSVRYANIIKISCYTLYHVKDIMSHNSFAV